MFHFIFVSPFINVTHFLCLARNWETTSTTDFHVILFCYHCVERIHKTVSIEAATVEIEERGVRLRLTVVDTPGYGDAMNSTDWYVTHKERIW